MNAVLNPPLLERVTLYYKEGASDKVYQCSIEPSGDLFLVNFAYGRRGSTLSTGTKTSSPVDFDTARKIYDKLVKEKTAKGYSPGEDGTPYQHTENEDRAMSILPQLLNPIEELEVHRLIKDSAWCLQEKKDGKRTLLKKERSAIHGINRKGLLIGLPSPIVHQIHKIAGDLVLDGECVGDVLYAFDLLQWGNLDLRNRPYEERWAYLVKVMEPEDLTHLELVDCAFTTARKALLFKKLQDAKREGVVLKRVDAPYIQATLTGEKVQFIYLGGSTPGERRSINVSLVFQHTEVGQIYVTGFCHRRQSNRVFSLDLVRGIFGWN